MATYKTDLIQAKDSLNISDKSAGNERTGTVILHAIAEYTFSGGEAYQNIEIAEIPKGATVVPELSYVTQKSSFGSLNLALGDAENSYRYGMAGTDVAPPGPSKMDYYNSCTGFFGYGQSGIPAPYVQPTRVQAYVMYPFGYPSPGMKAVFGIAYRVHA